MPKPERRTTHRNFKLKFVLQLIGFALALPALAQPTGHQRIFFEISDEGDTLHFENDFRRKEWSHKQVLTYKNYQLSDISENPTGFIYFPGDAFFQKTLMTHDHRIQIVRNGKDTMQIEILKAYRVYFLSISFQTGSYRMYVNDGKENQWNVQTLPYKSMEHRTDVYDITPPDWNDFRIHDSKNAKDYFISDVYEKYSLLEKPVLPEDDPNFKNPRRISTLRIETADYNFDGQLDYREHKLNNPKEWNYFIYQDTAKGYVLDSLMSRLNITNFDFEQKTFKVQKRGKTNAGIPETDTYEFVRGKATLVLKKPSTPDTIVGVQIQKDDKQTSVQTYLRPPFRFVLEKNTPGVELPAENDYYANTIRVYHQNTEKMIYSMVAVGNWVKQAPGCSDSIQIADYNFDGFPDFRICNISTADVYHYYIYHVKRDTFLFERTLSALYDLSFDFVQKIAIGRTGRKEFVSYPHHSPNQYYTEELQFEGFGLQQLTVKTMVYGGTSYTSSPCLYVNQKRIYEGDTIGLKLLVKNQISRTVGPFKFQVIFNPEENRTYDEKGSYVKIINIFMGGQNLDGFEMHGNYFREVGHWKDSLEIADYNFDGYPDLRIYNSMKADGRYVYLLYNSDHTVQKFYDDGLMSAAVETEFIPGNKIWKGKLVEANLTRYLFLKNDTLTISIKENNSSKPPVMEQYKYKNGKTSIRYAHQSLQTEIKRAYGDFNFDGFEDFRQPSKKSPYNWDVFLYNPVDVSYDKDTLLSKFEHFEFDPLDKTLHGYYTLRMGETTQQTLYYRWSFAVNGMVLSQKKVCYYKFPFSESSRCIVSRLIDGKWIDIEEFGAE